MSFLLACQWTAPTMSAGHSHPPPLTNPKVQSGRRLYVWQTASVPRAMTASATLNRGSRHVTGLARSKSLRSGRTSPILRMQGHSPARIRLVSLRRPVSWSSDIADSSSIVVSLPVFPFAAWLISDRSSWTVVSGLKTSLKP